MWVQCHLIPTTALEPHPSIFVSHKPQRYVVQLYLFYKQQKLRPKQGKELIQGHTNQWPEWTKVSSGQRKWPEAFPLTRSQDTSSPESQSSIPESLFKNIVSLPVNKGLQSQPCFPYTLGNSEELGTRHFVPGLHQLHQQLRGSTRDSEHISHSQIQTRMCCSSPMPCLSQELGDLCGPSVVMWGTAILACCSRLEEDRHGQEVVTEVTNSVSCLIYHWACECSI